MTAPQQFDTAVLVDIAAALMMIDGVKDAFVDVHYRPEQNGIVYMSAGVALEDGRFLNMPDIPLLGPDVYPDFAIKIFSFAVLNGMERIGGVN